MHRLIEDSGKCINVNITQHPPTPKHPPTVAVPWFAPTLATAYKWATFETINTCLLFGLFQCFTLYISDHQEMCCWPLPSCPTLGLLTKSFATSSSTTGRERWSPARFLSGPIWISLRCWLMPLQWVNGTYRGCPTMTCPFRTGLLWRKQQDFPCWLIPRHRERCGSRTESPRMSFR